MPSRGLGQESLFWLENSTFVPIPEGEFWEARASDDHPLEL